MQEELVTNFQLCLDVLKEEQPDLWFGISRDAAEELHKAINTNQKLQAPSLDDLLEVINYLRERIPSDEHANIAMARMLFSSTNTWGTVEQLKIIIDAVHDNLN